MKTTSLFSIYVALFTALIVFNSCDLTKKPDIAKKYPEGAMVWRNDTVITEHVIVPEGSSLYIEAGVTVVFDNTIVRPEIVVLGNLYCYGTSDNPIHFTVPENKRKFENRFDRLWGGIICGYDSKEVVLQYTTIEFGGAQTTEESESFKHQLFKTETGEGVPAFHFCNVDGQFVIQNCTFINNAEDHIYITGGKSIVSNNKFISNGFDGADAINYKSGCLADIAYNVIYDANTNAFKLSNGGALDPQAHIIIYNNTILNTGWRRPKVKGGSVWLESTVRAELYNNLFYDCRYAVKRDTEDPEDDRSVITPNFFFASNQTALDQYKLNVSKGQLVGSNDIVSESAGDKKPLFASFTQQAEVDVNAGITLSGNIPQEFKTSWNFHLSNTSPIKTGGKINFVRHFGTQGLVIEGKEYKSPEPESFFGAFGVE